ncbi:E3 ubiquitin-protein ligase RLIM-like [Paramacrobiotus metropolitanus]|uniref:E3 ubiquitin-protein ligase RLIM-like n=1 Tax=Paramacrobiotus metropolitanus TaxID=2943436 RepID=UPI002445CEA9|nr:E3 ubiquitin-protein ligase RLIM-like [Paramacrobiotus metropolitanus]
MDQSAVLPGSDDGGGGAPSLPSSAGLFHPLFDVLPSPTTSPVLPESLLMSTETLHPPLPVSWPYAQMDRNVSAAVMERIASSQQPLTSDFVFPFGFSSSSAFGLSDPAYSLPPDAVAHAILRNTSPANTGGYTGASSSAGAIRTAGMNQASTSASVVITPTAPSQPVNMPRVMPVLRAPSSTDGARREQRLQLQSLLQYVVPSTTGRPMDARSPPGSPVMIPGEMAVGPPNVNPFTGPTSRQRASVIQMSPSVSSAVDVSGEPARDIHPSPVQHQHQPSVHPYFHSRIHELEASSHRSHRLAVQEYLRSMQRAPRVQMLAAGGQTSSSPRDMAPGHNTSGLARAGNGRGSEAAGGSTGSSSVSGSGSHSHGYREHRSQVIYHDALGRSIPFYAIHRTENRAPVTVATGSSSQTSAVPSYSGFYQPVFRPVDTRQTSQAWNPPYATGETNDNQTETSSAGRTAAFESVSQRRHVRAGTCPYARPLAGPARGEAPPRSTVEWITDNEASSSSNRDVERSQAALMAAHAVRQHRAALSMEERSAALRQRQEHVTASGEQYHGRSPQEILRGQQMSNAEQRRRLIYIPQNQSHAGPPPYGRIAASLLQFMDAGAIFMHTDGEPKLILEEDVIAAIAMDTQSFEFDNQFPYNEECIICFEEFELKQEVRVLSCNKTHRFHKHCIDKWLIKNKPNCPICRQILPSLNQPKDAVVSGSGLADHHPLAHDPAVVMAGPSIPIPADEWN